MADEIAPGVVDSLRELLATGEVRFITATDAEPIYGDVLLETVEKEVGRINAAANEVAAVLQAYERAGKPFGLFLRSFELEAYQYDKASTQTDPEQRTLYTANGPSAVERRLHQALQHKVPFVAIRNQSSWLANGLIPRFTAEDTNWENWVVDLAKKASIIVLDCFALSPGVLKELSIMVSCGRQDATIVVLSEDNRGLRTELTAFEGLALTGFERPNRHHPALAAFSRVAHESEIDWDRIETSPLFADLLAAAEKQAAGDFSFIPPPHRLRLLGQRVRELRTKGEFDSAAELASEAISIATELEGPEYLANAHLSAGIVELERNRLTEALSFFHDSGLAFNQIGNKEGEAAAAMWTGLTYKRGGNADKAVMLFLIALQRSHEINAHSDMVGVLREMAPLLDALRPSTRRHPGVRWAARLIEELGLGGR